jgi:hypothetical protein
MALSEYEQSILDDIDQHGWSCVTVTDGDNAEAFAYSVGFGETLASPECIIFGLPPKLMHSMLWSMFHAIRRGEVLADGLRWPGLIEGFDCISRSVHSSQLTREHFNSALWHWGDLTDHGYGLKAFQLFWPGAVDGLFPWETGCSEIVRARQPTLYLPRGVGLQ